MNDMEPAESDVGEREIMREKETGVSRYAGQQRAQRSPIGYTGHALTIYWLLAMHHLPRLPLQH